MKTYNPKVRGRKFKVELTESQVDKRKSENSSSERKEKEYPFLEN